MSTAAELVSLLAERGWTVAVAESLTGGAVAAEIVSVPGASAVLRGGIVAYATDLKHSLLGVDAQLLVDHGAVDPDVARQMAEGARRVLSLDDGFADVGISTTGIAGPESPDGQPVGTVHIGIATTTGVRSYSHVFDGDRAQVRRQSVEAAITAACECISVGNSGA